MLGLVKRILGLEERNTPIYRAKFANETLDKELSYREMRMRVTRMRNDIEKIEGMLLAPGITTKKTNELQKLKVDFEENLKDAEEHLLDLRSELTNRRAQQTAMDQTRYFVDDEY